MNCQQEKEIIQTLVAAGHEPLAKQFARSRGYGVSEKQRRPAETALGAGKSSWRDPINLPSLDSLKYDPFRTRNLAEDIKGLKEIAQWHMKYDDKDIAVKLMQLARAVELGQARKAKPLYDKLAAKGKDELIPRRIVDEVHGL